MNKRERVGGGKVKRWTVTNTNIALRIFTIAHSVFTVGVVVFVIYTCKELKSIEEELFSATLQYNLVSYMAQECSYRLVDARKELVLSVKE